MGRVDQFTSINNVEWSPVQESFLNKFQAMTVFLYQSKTYLKNLETPNKILVASIKIYYVCQWCASVISLLTLICDIQSQTSLTVSPESCIS